MTAKPTLAEQAEAVLVEIDYRSSMQTQYTTDEPRSFVEGRLIHLDALRAAAATIRAVECGELVPKPTGFGDDALDAGEDEETGL